MFGTLTSSVKISPGDRNIRKPVIMSVNARLRINTLYGLFNQALLRRKRMQTMKLEMIDEKAITAERICK